MITEQKGGSWFATRSVKVLQVCMFDRINVGYQ